MSSATETINVGRPVEWMVSTETPQHILGVTYLFSLTGERITVWYTPDGMPAGNTRRLACLDDLTPGEEELRSEASPD
jgi:hypothetical protein